jgi:hypothetical protein
MNDLGLALVEEAGLALRQLLRKARARIKEKGTAIDTSLDTFMEYLINHTDHFRLLLREHTGNSKEFRTAISLEIEHFVAELEEYSKIRSSDANEVAISAFEQHALAEAMVIIAFNMGAVALDSTKKERDKILEKSKLQLRMLYFGAHYRANKK